MNKITKSQWMKLAEGKKSPLSPKAQEFLRENLDELRGGLSKQNLASGKTFGAAAYESLEQCKAYISSKNKKNPAVEFMNDAHAEMRAKWSKEIMTSQFSDRDLHDLEPEEIQEIRANGAEQTNLALGKLNAAISEYDNQFRNEIAQPVAAQQKELGAKPKESHQGEKPKIHEAGAKPQGEALRTSPHLDRPAEIQSRGNELHAHNSRVNVGANEHSPDNVKQHKLQLSQQQLVQLWMQRQNYRSAA